VSAIDDVLALLTATPAKQRQQALDVARKVTSDRPWVPNPGVQTQAYFCEADELFFGGTAGSSKTDLGIGLALTAHRRSLILRRFNKDAVKLVERFEQILGTRNGYNGQLQRWKRPGQLITFGGCENEIDKQRYKGEPYDLICVARGTPVLLADGSYRPVEALEVGQLLQTLEGPKRLVRRHPVQQKQCVEAVARDVSGWELARQVQSTTHPLLTDSGWLSAADLDGAYAAIRCHEGGMPSKSLRQKCASLLPFLLETTDRSQRRGECGQPLSSHRLGLAKLVSDLRSVLETGFAGCCDPHLEPLRLLLWFCREALTEPLLRSVAPSSFPLGVVGEGGDAPRVSSLQGWLDHYSFGIRPCGERIPQSRGSSTAVAVDPRCLLLRADAGQPSPSHSQADASGNTQTRTRWRGTYLHPYTKETRSVRAAGSLLGAALELSFVGDRDVYDLHVDEANHYITRGGFINKNCFDEGTDFLYSQYRFITAWNRSPDPKQRCRVLVPSNPPTRPEGLWVIKHWAAWLDDNHPNPAKPGELRWYTTVNGQDVEVDGRGPHVIEGEAEPVIARSRSVIFGKLSDNPDYARTNYASVLASLPDELRRAYRDGDFGVGLKDDDFQVIPTAWIEAAQQRWTEKIPPHTAMTAMAVDVAPGGGDQMVIAWRYGGWFAPLVAIREVDKTGRLTASHVVKHRRDRCPVIVDLGGGWGGDATIALKDNGIEVVAFNGVAASMAHTRDGKLKFRNKRAEATWRLREELDPSQEGGSTVALPPDPELKADLASYRWTNKISGITIEDKEKIRERLGRSPDKGDAVVMCASEGAKAVARIARRAANAGRQERANVGYAAQKQRFGRQ
jgi:hypothetical protein